MDFGEILEQWERETAKPGAFRSRGKTGVLAAETVVQNREDDSLIRWLNQNGIYDKDTVDGDLNQGPGEKRRRLLARKPDAELDLHGLNQDEAWDSLENFFAQAKREGFLKVSVIHGKGNHSTGDAVLKRIVRNFIERCPFAGESGQGDSRTGGSGATWVILKGY